MRREKEEEERLGLVDNSHFAVSLLMSWWRFQDAFQPLRSLFTPLPSVPPLPHPPLLEVD
jgi:hypothetical protein